jgi:hypothetical protein
MTQPPPVWTSELSRLHWEMEPNPEILKIFAGTDRYKMRPWWMSSDSSNYIATSRALFNPMQYAFRTVGLVRGAHPYSFVVDDLNKDDKTHLYQWVAMLNGGVRKATLPGLPANEIALAYREGDPDLTIDATQPEVVPQPGDPLLLVCAVGLQESGDAAMPLIQVQAKEGPKDKKGGQRYYDQIAINQRVASVKYKVLLLPFKMGEDRPVITADKASEAVSVNWEGQKDEFHFTADDAHRTHVTISRGGETLVESK